MDNKQDIIGRIKVTVKETDPGATVILFGSRARGDHREDSDYDLLVLFDKDEDKITMSDREKFAYPLYHIGTDTDTVISVKLYTKNAWANHRITPFYENVNNEGIIL